LALSVLVILIICPEALHGETLSPEEARRDFQPGRNGPWFFWGKGRATINHLFGDGLYHLFMVIWGWFIIVLLTLLILGK
jgi:hypothetical protein